MAELNDLLSGLVRFQLADAVAVPPVELARLSPYLQNYVAAMVEQVCARGRLPAPSWLNDVPPLEEPYFAAGVEGLRPYLLRASPVPFKRRNIFVDAAIGDRV
ncbi:MAG: hypothetical protein ACE5PT_11740 [Gemmatimonadales bacterium]